MNEIEKAVKVVEKARDLLVVSAVLLGMEEGDPGAIVLDLHSAKEKIENAINMIEGSIKASIGAA